MKKSPVLYQSHSGQVVSGRQPGPVYIAKDGRQHQLFTSHPVLRFLRCLNAVAHLDPVASELSD
jgi:hypothetical protein